MKKSFVKMHGLGNDFVVIDGRGEGWRPAAAEATFICDRREGVGCDQLIVLGVSPRADVFMHIYNPDGSEVGACGNATRCVARLLSRETGRTSVSIETRAGVLAAVVSGTRVTINMNTPAREWQQIPLAQAVDTASVTVPDVNGIPAGVAVNMGNPHIVFFVPDVTAVDVAGLGPRIETAPLFPQKTNVEFVQVIDRKTLRMRVWERGCGITRACGTGACASAVAAVAAGHCDRQVHVILDGGGLDIEWRESDNHVIMTGETAEVFRGEIEI